MAERDDDGADFRVHYDLGLEHERLFPGGTPSLEFARTLELLGRLLPAPPARIADIGGGTGAYAAPLARRGYDVSLIDSVELHVEMAREVSSRQTDHPFSVRLGDARRLDLPSGSFDAVLLLGPLYHLTERNDRMTAVREAFRTLKPGGVLMAAGISRFRSLIGGLVEGMLQDPVFRPIVERDLADGQHRNPEPVSRPEPPRIFICHKSWRMKSLPPAFKAWSFTVSRDRAGSSLGRPRAKKQEPMRSSRQSV